jgi:transcriptional regulator with XRE-family HTH domain
VSALGDELREHRKRLGISQRVAAQLLGVAPQTICYAETGKREPYALNALVGYLRLLTQAPPRIRDVEMGRVVPAADDWEATS